MNSDDQDPMLGSADEQAQYKQQILDMIQQDVDQRKQQRMTEFLRSRDSKAVIIGMTGTADGSGGAIGDLGE